MIYFIQDTGTGYHKIGYTSSKSANGRLGSCQTGNPNELVLIGTIEGSQEYEAELHKEYYNKNIRNEWFSLTEDEVKNIILEHGGDIVPSKQDEETKQYLKWKKRAEEIEEKFSIPNNLLYKEGSIVPLLEDQQIEELSKQLTAVQKAIENSTKNYKNITCSAVQIAQQENHFWNDKEGKTHAIFKISPTININFSLTEEAEQFIEKEVNDRFQRRIKFLNDVCEEKFELAKKNANMFLVEALEIKEATQKELEEKIKALEKEKEQSTKENAKNILLKALETM